MFLLEQRRLWGRWTNVDTAALDIAFERSEVADELIRALITARTGPVAELLRSMLRTAVFDGRLPELAKKAFLPSIRGIALRAMIDGARWPTHREKRWLDKSMGVYRYDWVYVQRDVNIDLRREDAAALAAGDRSAAVRRLAVIALLTLERPLDNFDEVAGMLTNDRNLALRERTAYAINIRAESGKSKTTGVSPRRLH